MKWGEIAALVVFLAGLSGCGTPVVSTQRAEPETLGKSAFIKQYVNTRTGGALVVAFSTSNHDGKLAVCGLYIYSGQAEKQREVQSYFEDVNSSIEIGTTKAQKGVRLRPNFFFGYLAPADFDLPQNPASDIKAYVAALNRAKLGQRNAGCVTTAESWRDTFAEQPFGVNLVTTTYRSVPVVYVHH